MHEKDGVKPGEKNNYRFVKSRELNQSDLAVSEAPRVVPDNNLHAQQQLAKLHREILHLTRMLTEREEQIDLLYNSTSWRITEPLRFLGDNLRKFRRILKLIGPAIMRGGGLVGTLKRVRHIYSREGLNGLKRRLSQLNGGNQL